MRGRFVNQRVAPAPMETNGIAVVPADDGSFTVWVSTQIPFDVRDDLAETSGSGAIDVRAIAPDVGGAFGAKMQVYAEYLRWRPSRPGSAGPVRWQETVRSRCSALTHGRAQVQRVEVGAKRDGTLVGLRAELLADMGAYPVGGVPAVHDQEMSPGVYRPARRLPRTGVVTNATPVLAYRGAGRPEATALIERAMDMVADELEMDPVELRSRNLIRPDAFPHTTVTGATYDTGDYESPSTRARGWRATRSCAPSRRHGGRAATRAARHRRRTYVEMTAFGRPGVRGGRDRRRRLARRCPSERRRPGTGTRPRSRRSSSAALGVPFET